MSLSNENVIRILDTLQGLFDEGWESGFAYYQTLASTGTDEQKDAYWDAAEVRESKICLDALAYIYHEITGENISNDEDTTDTGDQPAVEDGTSGLQDS